MTAWDSNVYELYAKYLIAKAENRLIMNKYICTGCGTTYSTPEDKAPPTPNWDDEHKCTLVKKDDK